MKRILSFLFITLLTISCQSSFAASTGLFFNIETIGPTLIITTTPVGKTYTAAGIKINTIGYIFPVPGQCVKNANGYCIFQVSDTSPAPITIVGAPGAPPLVITLCLNGLGPLTCQLFTPFLPI